MDRRRFLRAVLGVGVLSITGCRSGSSSGQARPIRLLEPGELDPAPRLTLRLPGPDYGGLSPIGYYPPGYEHASYVFDTLLWADVTGKILPWLAVNHATSPDGLVHTFELRRGVRWHDGEPFDADDVVFSFDYAAGKNGAPGLAPWTIFGPKHVESVKATGESTVQVTLDKPAANFVSQVAARLLIFPRHLYERAAAQHGGALYDSQELWVGTGPYVFKSYGGSGRGGYLFEANDRFFLGRPFVRRLELHPVADELVAVRAGELDAGGLGVTPTSAKVLTPFREDPDFGVIEGPYDFLTALHFNLQKGGALSDVRFRRAVALAVDRQDMVKRLLGGMGAPGNPGFLAPGNSFTVEVEQYRHDVGAANRLLDDAGYERSGGGVRVGPGGRPLAFRVKGLSQSAQAFELISQALAAVGVKLTYEPIQDLFSGLGDYELALIVYGGVAEDPDFLRVVFSSREERKLFFGAKGYTNPEFDDLAERQLVTLDSQERKQLVGRMQEIVASDLPVLHLYHPRPFMVFKKSVFDQWAWHRGGMGPYNKQVLVTGVGTGGTQIRRVAEG